MIFFALAAGPIQIGGCGRCAVGGSTTILSNCQYFPRWENGSSAVHALRMTSRPRRTARRLPPSARRSRQIRLAIALADAEIEPPAG